MYLYSCCEINGLFIDDEQIIMFTTVFFVDGEIGELCVVCVL